MCANYPKGRGELFHKCIDTYYPGVLLLHIERASVSCQDLSVNGAGVLHMNRPYWIEFLDERLQTTGDEILQENIFIILLSLEMADLAHLFHHTHQHLSIDTLVGR